MKIVGIVFDYNEGNRYERLTRVWAKSIEVNCPAAEVTILKIDPPKQTKRKIGLSSNWHKFKRWVDFARDQRDGENVILMDTDMIVLNDLRPAFNEDFDIGLTVRTKANWKYNGGVVFVKISDATREFLRQWGEIDERMYRDEKFHAPYSKKYKGQNQSSLGYMVEHNESLKIREFPCAIWNACNEDWIYIDDNTKVIHLKSNLRLSCLGEVTGAPSKMRRAFNEFKKYERMVVE
ncbi:MAG: putative nucleotide-diphospho-sugar transferase [Chloroflexota bacterium]